MKRFLKWLLGLFKKQHKMTVGIVSKVAIPQPKEVVEYPKQIIKITSGKKHVWVKTRYGVIRKPIGEII